MIRSRISCWIASGIAVTASMLLVQTASAQTMPGGGSKLYPWNIMGYQGYNEPPHDARPRQPNAAPIAPARYQVAITTVPLPSPDEYQSNRAMMMAHLPENAQLWIEDKEMMTKGLMREFVSPPLASGRNFVYTVRVDWLEDAQVVSRTQEFNVRAGAVHCIYLVRNESTEADLVIDENLKKLSAEDRKLVEAQRSCPVQDHNRLGIMSVPVKVMLKGEPVWLCCDACVRKAQRNPDQVLARVKELKDRSATSKE